MLALIDVLGLDPDLQGDLAAGGGRVLAGVALQVARDESEEIGRLLVRVFPDHARESRLEHLGAQLVAVRQHDRVLVRVAVDGHGEGRHDVGAIEVPGDAAEALGLALGAEVARGLVEPGQGQVFFGLDRDRGLEDEGSLRNACDRELLVGNVVGHLGTVDGDPPRVEQLAHQLEWLRAVVHRVVDAHHQLGVHQGLALAQLKTKLDGVDPEVGLGVVLAVNRGGSGGRGDCGRVHGSRFKSWGVRDTAHLWGGQQLGRLPRRPLASQDSAKTAP